MYQTPDRAIGLRCGPKIARYGVAAIIRKIICLECTLVQKVAQSARGLIYDFLNRMPPCVGNLWAVRRLAPQH